MIYGDKLASRIEVSLPSNLPPELLEIHKELAEEYKDDRITIHHKKKTPDEEE